MTNKKRLGVRISEPFAYSKISFCLLVPDPLTLLLIGGRHAFAGEYCVSKHAVERLEWLVSWTGLWPTVYDPRHQQADYATNQHAATKDIQACIHANMLVPLPDPAIILEGKLYPFRYRFKGGGFGAVDAVAGGKGRARG